MPSPKKLMIGAALAAAAIAPTAAAAQAETVLSQEPATTLVGAYNGTVMWSTLDQATGQYRLVKSVDGGAPQAVPVPERPAPVDIDLGSNRSRSTYAVYTRNGDIYRLSAATGVETKLTRLSSPTAAERDPTIERGEIAFIRHEGGFDQLRIGNTTSGSHGTRMLLKLRQIDSVELGIKQVAYVADVKSGFGRQHVHVRNISTGHDQVVYKAVSGGANSANVTKPSFTDDLTSFVWARTNIGSNAGNRLVKYTLRTGKLSYGQGQSRWNSTAWAGNALGAAASSTIDAESTPGTSVCTDAGVQYCRVTLTGPVSFDLRP
jgi:hypothetical protein